MITTTNLHTLNKRQSIDYLRHILIESHALDPKIIDDIYRTLIEDSGAAVRAQMEIDWYNTTDFGIYALDNYLIEAWYCWHNYSRQYITSITKPNTVAGKSISDLLPTHPLIVDLGNGLGLTSAAIKRTTPNATVIGTNIKPSTQFTIAEHIAHAYNFTMTDDINTISDSVDLVFASEYFEHHPEPVEHLDHIINTLNPHRLLIANAFTAQAIGHFNHYTINGKTTPNKQTGRIFNTRLREHGYTQTDTTLWNHRPALWTRQ